MIDLSSWMPVFMQALKSCFGKRIWFVGLQGSYGRGEANETSDLDVVVILDELSAVDIAAYHAMLDTLPNREMICGFLSGKKELLNWEPSDLFQFYYDTIPLEGSLGELLPRLDKAAIEKAIKTGACNIYHGCVHNMVHDKSEEILHGLYKSAVFVVQAIIYMQTGCYTKQRIHLLTAASQGEREIVDIYQDMKAGKPTDFWGMSEKLFAWAQRWVQG